MVDLKRLKVHDIAQDLSRDTWLIVTSWAHFDRDTLGKQMVRSADSIRANIAEAHGRFTFAEKVRFCHIARGSLVEYSSHLRAAFERELISELQFLELRSRSETIGRMLNWFIRYLRIQSKRSS